MVILLWVLIILATFCECRKAGKKKNKEKTNSAKPTVASVGGRKNAGVSINDPATEDAIGIIKSGDGIFTENPGGKKMNDHSMMGGNAFLGASDANVLHPGMERTSTSLIRIPSSEIKSSDAARYSPAVTNSGELISVRESASVLTDATLPVAIRVSGDNTVSPLITTVQKKKTVRTIVTRDTSSFWKDVTHLTAPVIDVETLPDAYALTKPGSVSSFSRRPTDDGTLSSDPEPEGGETTDRDTYNPFTGESFAEPTPSWQEAKSEWKQAWIVHIYTVGGLFSLLALYSLYCIMRIKTLFLISKGYFISLNVLMLIFGVSRAFYMFMDAYNSHGKLPTWLAYYLQTISFPCLTAAFSILFFALVRTTRMSAMPQRVFSAVLLVIVIVLHFILVFATDFVVGYLSTAVVLLFVCQVVFIVWCLCLTMLYFYVFVRLYHAAVARQKQIYRQSFTEVTISGVQTVKKGSRVRLSRAIGVTLVTAIFGLLCASLQCLAVILVYGLQRTDPPKPWPWWTYQLVSRLCELGMCATMSYVASQPLYQPETNCCSCCKKKKKEEPLENPYWVNNTSHALADRYYHTDDSNHSDHRVDDQVPLQAREPVDLEVGEGTRLRPVSELSAASSHSPIARPMSTIEDATTVVQFHRASVHDGEASDGQQTEPSTPGTGPFGTYLPESSAPPWKTSYQRLAKIEDVKPTPNLQFKPESFTEYDRLGYRKPIRIDSEKDREAAGVTFGKHRSSSKDLITEDHISNQSTFRSSWAPSTKKGYSILSNASPEERVYDEPILPRNETGERPLVARYHGCLHSTFA